jgi:hypothetical protein
MDTPQSQSSDKFMEEGAVDESTLHETQAAEGPGKTSRTTRSTSAKEAL